MSSAPYMDFVIVSPLPRSETIAVVEINNRPGLSEADAADAPVILREWGARYYMLVSQDVALLFWQNFSARIPMRNVMQRFFPNRSPQQPIYAPHVEAVVSTWLAELAAGVRGSSDDPESALTPTGFLDAIRGAKVLAQARV